MKKTFQSAVSGILIGLLAVGLYCLPSFAVNGDILTFTGSGSLNNTEVFRVDVNGAVLSSTGTVITNTSGTPQTRILGGDIFNNDDVFLTGSDAVIQYGDANGLIAVSTAITTLTSNGISYPFFLTGIVATTEGVTVCASTAATISGGAQGASVVVCSTDVARRGDTIGIARTAVSTGSVVEVFTSGIVLVLSSGTVVAGDLLITTQTATPGLLAAYERGTTLTSTNSVVAVALGIGVPSTAGLVKARLVR